MLSDPVVLEDVIEIPELGNNVVGGGTHKQRLYILLSRSPSAIALINPPLSQRLTLWEKLSTQHRIANSVVIAWLSLWQLSRFKCQTTSQKN
jgi:hypothetical protein